MRHPAADRSKWKLSCRVRLNGSGRPLPLGPAYSAWFLQTVAADAAFYSAKNEAAAKAQGVKRVCIPNRSTKSPERKREQRKRWFRNGQRWRTGCEGRISVAKRRHGLDRCRYKGDAGMKRWVGLGVIADNIINIGRAMEKQAAP
jgi:IS5 family transposase